MVTDSPISEIYNSSMMYGEKKGLEGEGSIIIITEEMGSMWGHGII